MTDFRGRAVLVDHNVEVVVALGESDAVKVGDWVVGYDGRPGRVRDVYRDVKRCRYRPLQVGDRMNVPHPLGRGTMEVVVDQFTERGPVIKFQNPLNGKAEYGQMDSEDFVRFATEAGGGVES